MKKICYFLGIIAMALGMGSCADLGFGLDVDDGYSPYYYGGPYYNGIYGSSPFYGYDFPYYNVPPAPPVVGNGPGSIVGPAPVRPKPESPRPPQNVGPSNPGASVPRPLPSAPGGVSRPGNGGLPSNPSNVPTGKPLRGR